MNSLFFLFLYFYAMTTKNHLINYTITTTDKPNENGRYILALKVNWQAPEQVATHMVDLVYKAKNGYTIRSGNSVSMSPQKKNVWLLGSMEHWVHRVLFGKIVPADREYEAFETKEEMEAFKKDIIEAINDWAENGGFDTSHLKQETYEA